MTSARSPCAPLRERHVSRRVASHSAASSASTAQYRRPIVHFHPTLTIPSGNDRSRSRATFPEGSITKYMSSMRYKELSTSFFLRGTPTSYFDLFPNRRRRSLIRKEFKTYLRTTPGPEIRGRGHLLFGAQRRKIRFSDVYGNIYDQVCCSSIVQPQTNKEI